MPLIKSESSLINLVFSQAYLFKLHLDRFLWIAFLSFCCWSFLLRLLFTVALCRTCYEIILLIFLVISKTFTIKQDIFSDV